MIYHNIFHYFRGQTKDSDEQTAEMQLENNVTKAFLNVLQHSSPSLRSALLRSLGFTTDDRESAEYNYQTGSASKLIKITKHAAVLAISEDGKVTSNGVQEKNTIADGAIVTESASLIIEVKIRSNPLYMQQLEDHCELFAEGQAGVFKPSIIVRTWKEIRALLRLEYDRLHHEGELVSCFLIEQFEEFANFNWVGKERMEAEDLIRLFRTDRERQLAREVHHYILNKWPDRIEVVYPRVPCIEYKWKDRQHRNFLTLIPDQERRGLIVRRKGNGGIALQTEIDAITGFPMDRNKWPDNEAFIRFDYWKNDSSALRAYIDGTLEIF